MELFLFFLYFLNEHFVVDLLFIFYKNIYLFIVLNIYFLYSFTNNAQRIVY